MLVAFFLHLIDQMPAEKAFATGYCDSFVFHFFGQDLQDLQDFSIFSLSRRKGKSKSVFVRRINSFPLVDGIFV
jgi:hypothetical protein